jgi:superfamily II DNA or RNA helicase
MNLRPYQTLALDEYFWVNSQRVLFVSPTGSGKTVLIAALIEKCRGAVLFLTHRQEILFQARSYFGQCNVIKAGHDYECGSRITVAQVQTLARRTPPPADMVISDECHHIRGEQWNALLEKYPNAIHLGLTATPWRLDGKGLGSIYSTVIDVATIDDLIRDGWLVPPVYYGAKILPNTKKVKKVGGDYNLGELSAVCRERTIVAGVIESINKYKGRNIVVYAVDCEHAAAICKEYPTAMYLDGTTDPDERNSILETFKREIGSCIVNVNVLTEGWDSPVADCILLARPTCSTGLYMQMIGRGLRPYPGKKDCLIIDHGGNVHRHGFAEDKREYSLEDGLFARKKKAAESLHTCPYCLAIFLGMECPACGKTRPTTRTEVVEQEQELVKLERSKMPQEDRKKEYLKLLNWAKYTRRSPGAAYGRFKAAFGCAPDPKWDEGVSKWGKGGKVWIKEEKKVFA